MATLGNEVVDIVLPDGTSTDEVEITTGPDGANKIETKAAISSLEITAQSGNTEISGAKLSNSQVAATPAKGETATVVVESTVFKGNTIRNSGQGFLDLTVNTPSFKKSTIEGGKKADSVSFGNQTTIKKGNIDLGKGDDTVTFKADTSFKSKTTLDLGNKGSDVVEFAEAPKGGKVIISNFDKKDTLVVGGETFTYDDLKGGAEVPGIKIKFND